MTITNNKLLIPKSFIIIWESFFFTILFFSLVLLSSPAQSEDWYKADDKHIASVSFIRNKIDDKDQHLSLLNKSVNEIDSATLAIGIQNFVTPKFSYIYGVELGVGLKSEEEYSTIHMNGKEYQYDAKWDYNTSIGFNMVFAYDVNAIIYFFAGPSIIFIVTNFSEKVVNTATGDIEFEESHQPKGFGFGARFGLGVSFSPTVKVDFSVTDYLSAFRGSMSGDPSEYLKGVDISGRKYNDIGLATYRLTFNYYF